MLECPLPQTPAYALESLATSPYGFTIVDLGIPEEALQAFSKVVVTKDSDCHTFGNLEGWKERLQGFLKEVGPNADDLVSEVAHSLYTITEEIFRLSCEETFWAGLISSTPNTLYDIPRWHMDGQYFKKRQTPSVPYKFVFAPLGPSTLFYLLPTELRALRSWIWQMMGQRTAMQQFCSLGPTIQPEVGYGAFLMGCIPDFAALHSEPPIHEDRLFLSIIPCSLTELDDLFSKLKPLYPGVLPKKL